MQVMESSLTTYYPPVPVYSNNILQLATCGPVGQWRTLLQATTFVIANAKRYIYIQTPYFLPTEGLNQALQTAALGGVDVTVDKGMAVSKFYTNSTLKGVHEGKNHLDGKRALAYSRERKAYLDGDVQRARNQQQVLHCH